MLPVGPVLSTLRSGRKARQRKLMRPTPEIIAKLPKALVSDFAFTNTAGGTGMSNWDHNKRFDSPCEVLIFKAWTDEETGLHFVGIGQGDALKCYLNEVCGKDAPQPVYFSEFSLVDPGTAQKLVQALMELADVASTPDGYVFKRQCDGTWGDGDMSWPSIEAIMDETDATIEVTELTGPRMPVDIESAPTC